MRVSGWAQVSAFIVGYEILHSKDGRLLSEEADIFIARHPVVARLVIWGAGLLLTAHVANCVPTHLDPVSKTFWRNLFS
ncbi:hypothetical protein PBI_GAIA_124 [Mycobacterium phage Gaia]|uniref:Uncharacterized protein n=1 Tax=Mycobacterium phage Gaia TaxID=1486472 RepID=A0A068F3L6_9CAUD|nr:hypothetical protein VC46_gp109 [Mycobacterium phage Gaia]AID58943.1 hypothetical protein PBI_GAIA_124 [Mycobacterium phage Gaia]AYR00060.1 hypothetical protein PBI_NEBKISS_125 [Mycobacterium phage Nebkiss]